MSLIHQIKSRTLKTLFQLPEFAKRRLVGKPVLKDGLELDLDMQLMLLLSNLEKSPRLQAAPEKMARTRKLMQQNARLVEGAPLDLTTRDLVLEHGQQAMAARLYTPTQPIDALLLYFHGGGWAQGDLDSHDYLCRFLCERSGAHVISVDYPLAPEHRFPAAVKSTLAAYQAVVARLAEWGVSRPVIAVGGDSAGANLATVLARHVVPLAVPQPVAQMLIYPAVDSSRDHPSKLMFADGFLLTLENIRDYESFYIPTAQDRFNPDISPLLATDQQGVAPAIVITAGFDPLRDEGRAYADKLESSGVAVTRLEYPGLIHGFANMLCTRSAKNAVEESVQALRAQLLRA